MSGRNAGGRSPAKSSGPQAAHQCPTESGISYDATNGPDCHKPAGRVHRLVTDSLRVLVIFAACMAIFAAAELTVQAVRPLVLTVGAFVCLAAVLIVFMWREES